ncbi:hypothetical protein D9M71_697300 [compost metagenome]
MIHLSNPLNTAGFGELIVRFQVVERVQQKRQLIDWVERQVDRFSVEEYDLVMQLGVLGHEKQTMSCRGDTFVTDDEAQRTAVKIDHAIKVSAKHTRVGEIDGW